MEEEYKPPQATIPNRVEPLLPFSKLYPFLAGSAYGLCIRLLIHFAPEHAWLQIMGWVFAVLTPVFIGAITVYLAFQKSPRSYRYCFIAPWLSVALFLISLGLVAIEGSICIWLATPLFALLGSLGGVLTGLVLRHIGKRGLPSLLLLPFVLGINDPARPMTDEIVLVQQSINIAAPASQIWQEILSPQQIKPEELGSGLAYRIGVPHPVAASLNRPGVGGIRHSEWQRGVQFDEEITEWQAEKTLAWIYHFGPRSFPPGSMDEHVVIGGRYFDLQHTRYTLTPNGNHTKLEVEVRFRVSTGFNWYTVPVAKLMVSDTAHSILEFYRQRSESKAKSGA